MCGRMVDLILVTIQMIKRMDMVNLYGQMGSLMRVNGRMGDSTVKGLS